jgi:hypothetical protein
LEIGEMYKMIKEINTITELHTLQRIASRGRVVTKQPSSIFRLGDAVRLLDGRIGFIWEQNIENDRYFRVVTNDDTGELTYFKMYCDDMKLILF